MTNDDIQTVVSAAIVALIVITGGFLIWEGMDNRKAAAIACVDAGLEFVSAGGRMECKK